MKVGTLTRRPRKTDAYIPMEVMSPAVQEPAYAMSIFTPRTASNGTPFPG
jgi:hypothetical protein